ncbi:MAG: phage tail tube protein [Proteobacteria bacterium]|nr:phage tail tube protein [Pseudomonadota bacterium]
MSNLPSFLLRNCMLWADKESKIGQIGDITIPVPTEKMEEMRNAGMVKPREVSLGYEKLEFGFKMPGFDPQIMKLFGLAPGTEKQFLVTGALADEDGTMHSAVLTMYGRLKTANGGTWKPGEVSENDLQCSVNRYKLEVDGDPILEIDDFDVIVGGTSTESSVRSALLL